MINANNNNQSPSLGTLLLRAGGVLLGIAVLDSILSNKNNTVNYVLKDRGRKVYHGVVFEDRLDTRIYEHECSGKKFDECVYDDPKPREEALRLEKKRIKRDRTKYNVHHRN